MLSADAVRCLREAIDAHQSAIGDHRDAMRGHERAARIVQSLADRGGISQSAVRAAVAAHHRAMGLHRRAADEHEGCLDALTEVLDRSRNPADNTKLVQTSSGLAQSTGSSGGRALSRAARQARALALAPPPTGDGAAGIAHVRDAEFRRAQLHCTLVGEAIAGDGDYLQRQAALRRLARGPSKENRPAWGSVRLAGRKSSYRRVKISGH
jgi:hypothetical protein